MPLQALIERYEKIIKLYDSHMTSGKRKGI